MADLPLRPGALVDGRYRLDEPLDDFGVGESWRALDNTDRSVVIVKLLPPFGPTEHAATTRFHDLGRALAATRHRGIIATLRHGVAQGRPYLVHEPFAGVSLAKGLALARTGRHLLAPGVLANLLDRACEAVDAAHRATPPLVHGGLMPGSVIAAMVAGRFDLRVIDFGLMQTFGDRIKIARSTEYEAPSAEHTPEQATPPDDVFALGALVIEAVTDRRDAQLGGTLGNLSAVAKRRADIPPALMAIGSRATRVGAKHRFPDVASMRDALAAAWSPDARPDLSTSDVIPPGIAGVAANYTSWVRFSEPDEPVAIAPLAPLPVSEPLAPLPVEALVGTPDDLSITRPTVRNTAEELFGPTARIPPKEPVSVAADLGQTFVVVSHPPTPPAMPATQLLQEFDASQMSPAPPAPLSSLAAAPMPAPPAYPQPQRVYGAAPGVYGHGPIAPLPSPKPKGGRALLAAIVVAVLLIVIAVVVWLVAGG